MKLVVLATHFHKGGAEKQLGMIAPQLAFHGAEVAYVSIAGQEAVDPVSDKRLRYISLGVRRFRSREMFRRTFDLLRRERPDVVLSCVTACDFMALCWKRLTGTPWVMREASSFDPRARSDDVHLRRILGRCADVVVANNHEGYSYWEPRRGKRRTEWIPNLMDVDWVRARADLPASIDLPKGPYLVAVGRLEPVKNFVQPLRAFAELTAAQANVRLLFVGEGQRRGELEALAGELGIRDRVLFTGYLSNPLPVIKASHGLILSSVYEGCPNVALEAYSLGAPLLLSDIPAHRAIFSGEDAAFFPLHDCRATASALADHLAERRRGPMRPALIDSWRATTNGLRFFNLISEVAS